MAEHLFLQCLELLTSSTSEAQISDKVGTSSLLIDKENDKGVGILCVPMKRRVQARPRWQSARYLR